MHAGFGGRPFEVGFEGFGQQLAAEARALCQHRVLQGVRAVRPLFRSYLCFCDAPVHALRAHGPTRCSRGRGRQAHARGVAASGGYRHRCGRQCQRPGRCGQGCGDFRRLWWCSGSPREPGVLGRVPGVGVPGRGSCGRDGASGGARAHGACEGRQGPAQLDAQPPVSLLRDAGGWSSASMPLYYGGHSIEGSELISAYMVRPVTALPK